MTRSQAGRLGAAITSQKFRADAIKAYYASPNHCLQCGKIIHVTEGTRVADIRHKKFCNQSCGAKYSNLRRERRTPRCVRCNKHVNKGGNEYCSSQCQADQQYLDYIERWKDGLENGIKGGGMSISRYIRRHLFEKRGPICWHCGWSRINPKSGNVPLQVNHIDGDPLNNKEENLELICPNCHSITPTYMALNRGNGREIRRKYYRKSVGAE